MRYLISLFLFCTLSLAQGKQPDLFLVELLPPNPSTIEARTIGHCGFYPFPSQHPAIYPGMTITGTYDWDNIPCEEPFILLEAYWLDMNGQEIRLASSAVATGLLDLYTVPNRYAWPADARYLQLCYSIECFGTGWITQCCDYWAL